MHSSSLPTSISLHHLVPHTLFASLKNYLKFLPVHFLPLHNHPLAVLSADAYTLPTLKIHLRVYPIQKTSLNDLGAPSL